MNFLVRRRRLLLGLLLLLPVLAAGAETARVLFWTNRHTVIAGRVYRCSQPRGEDIQDLVDQHGIKTVLNLRGMCPDMPWYQEECRTCAQLGISQEDITLSANRLPPPAELRRVVEVLDRTEYPILIHCKAGADRTGLISALILLLQTDASLATARYQLLPRYGHFRFARTAEIDRFFDLYEEYLAREQRPHTSAYFRDWILTKYQAGPAASELTWALPIPESVPADEYFGLTVRAKNCSNTPWVLKPGTYAGIHLAFGVYNDLGESVWSGRAGLRHEIVPPGRTTDIMIPINPLKPGQYTVIAEIHDATGAGIPFRTNSFVQYGDESLAATLIAR